MQIDTAGTYTLKYTAEDACGNITEVTREVVAEQISYRTVLYTDGTFIINEKSTDIDANVAEHGVATNVYDPFDPNGDTPIKRYEFSTASNRPYQSDIDSITSVEIGSPISPTSMAFWFSACRNCTSINLNNLDTSFVTSMASLFVNCNALPSLDLSNFNTSNVTDMSGMFEELNQLTSIDISSFDTSNVTNMRDMFNDCKALTSIDLSNFNTSNVTNMENMFLNCEVAESIVITSFDTQKVTNMRFMFSGCRAMQTIDLSSFNTPMLVNTESMFAYTIAVVTIYASSAFVTDRVTQSGSMFGGSHRYLVGGAGTNWTSMKPTDKTYARIDNPPTAPGYFTLKSA